MIMTSQQWWDRCKEYSSPFPALALSIELSQMNFHGGYFTLMKARMQKAFAAMADWQKSTLANPDKKRKVGHYWLRNSVLATMADIKNFAKLAHR
jgi:glucose-6-phosphate isomerase